MVTIIKMLDMDSSLMFCSPIQTLSLYVIIPMAAEGLCHYEYALGLMLSFSLAVLLLRELGLNHTANVQNGSLLLQQETWLERQQVFQIKQQYVTCPSPLGWNIDAFSDLKSCQQEDIGYLLFPDLSSLLKMKSILWCGRFRHKNNWVRFRERLWFGSKWVSHYAWTINTHFKAKLDMHSSTMICLHNHPSRPPMQTLSHYNITSLPTLLPSWFQCMLKVLVTRMWTYCGADAVILLGGAVSCWKNWDWIIQLMCKFPAACSSSSWKLSWGATSPQNEATKYVTRPCPLQWHIDSFSDLASLSAGEHHLSVPSKRVIIVSMLKMKSKVWCGRFGHKNNWVGFRRHSSSSSSLLQ